MKIPLVLLHGWGVNAQVWNPILARLRDSFEVHLLDLPGYGNDADYQGSYSAADVVERLMDQAPERAHWVGWSLGATVAMLAAIQFPSRFLSLQLVSPTPKFLSDADWEFGMDAQPLKQLASLFESDYQKGLKKFLLLQMSNQTQSRQVVRQQVESMLEFPEPSSSTLHGSLDLLTRTDLRADIGQLEVRTSILAGVHDRIVPCAASQWIAEQIPNADWCMLETGHLLFQEAPAPFLEHVLKFTHSCQPRI